MRIVIFGSRTFDDYELLKRTMDTVTTSLKKFVIVSGHADGADKLGERWALENDKIDKATLEIHRADWKKHGKAAGPIRNQEMVESGLDGAVCFWDGKSKGTEDMLDKCRKAGVKRIKVVRF